MPVREGLPNVVLCHMFGLAYRRRVRGLAVDEPFAFLVREPLAVCREVGDEEEGGDADDERCESLEDENPTPSIVATDTAVGVRVSLRRLEKEEEKEG